MAAAAAAAAARGARPVGPQEQLTMEPQSKGAGTRAGAGGRACPERVWAPCARLRRLLMLLTWKYGLLLELSSLGETRRGLNPAKCVRREPEGRVSSVVWAGGCSAASVFLPEMTPKQIHFLLLLLSLLLLFCLVV